MWEDDIMEIMSVNGKEYRINRLLGHGKGGYSYLAVCGEQEYVLKQIHHEPCSYYQFGNKIEAEKRDYERLKKTGIRMPEMIDLDEERERIVRGAWITFAPIVIANSFVSRYNWGKDCF